MRYVLLLLICIMGSAVQSSIGFGFAILAIPLFSLILPIKYGIVVLAVSAMILSVHILLRMELKIKWKLVLPIITCITVGQYIGTNLLLSLDIIILKNILGVILVVISIFMFFSFNRFKIRINISKTVFFGTLSGLLGGMLGISGPPLVVYYLSALDNKQEYQSSMQTTLLLMSIFTLVLHGFYGNINSRVLTFSLFGITGVFIGSTIGLFIFKRVKKESLGKPVYAFIFLMGVWMLVERFIINNC